MPVFDFGRFVMAGIKIILFGIFATWFFLNLENFNSFISAYVNGAFNIVNGLANIHFGCLADKLGLTSLVNSLIAQIYVVSTLTISSMGSILTVKYITQFFGFLMRV